MITRRTLVGVCLALLFLLALLVTAPAQLLLPLMSEGQVRMQGLSGTVWRGSASRVQYRLPAGYLHLGRVEWTLKPLSLLLFSPRLAINSQWGSQSLSAELVLHGAGDVDLSGVEAVVAAGLVRQFAPVALGGNLSLQMRQLQLRDGWPVQANGRLVWQDGSWIGNQGARPLGDYAVDFTQLPGEPLRGVVISLSGEVEASGSLLLRSDTWEVDIALSGPGLEDPQLQQALQLIGTPEGGGYRVKLDGELPL